VAGYCNLSVRVSWGLFWSGLAECLGLSCETAAPVAKGKKTAKSNKTAKGSSKKPATAATVAAPSGDDEDGDGDYLPRASTLTSAAGNVLVVGKKRKTPLGGKAVRAVGGAAEDATSMAEGSGAGAMPAATSRSGRVSIPSQRHNG